MSQGQKVIKYCAIALAISLIVSIFSGIFYGVGMIGNLFGGDSNNTQLTVIPTVDTKYDNLKIELKYSELVIEKGDNFYLESTNADMIDVNERNGSFIVKEKNRKLFNSGNSNKVVLTIPENYNFNDVSIETGAGSVNVSDITADVLDLELGAGKVNISNLNILRETDIEGGVGKIDITNCIFDELSLSIGVGDTEIDGIFTGNTEIETGVGSVNIKLNDGIENYKFYVEKGIGSIHIDGESVNNGNYGNGTKRFEVEGGIGSIKIS